MATMIPPQEGASQDHVSFQRVIVPLLRLVTLPALANTPLTRLYTPIVATLLDPTEGLQLADLERCLRELAARGSIEDPAFTARDKVRLARPLRVLPM